MILANQPEITFVAEVYKLQTLVDNGVRVTLDLPETCIMQMAQLAECKRAGVVLNIVATPLHNNGGTVKNAVGKRAERKSCWQSG